MVFPFFKKRKNFTNKNKIFSTGFTPLDKKYLTGFTLVEMITAVAIFSMVMVIAMGALLSVLGANKQTQSMQTVVNNLGLAMEMMSREIRTGYVYHCGDSGDYTQPQDCLNGENFIAFESHSGSPSDPDDQVIFRLRDGQIQKSTDGGNTFLNLTSPELILENLSFCVVGSDPDDTLQPKVLIIVNGYVKRGTGMPSYFNLQTTVSQRILDF